MVCVEREAGIVDDFYCNISSKPYDMERVCNDHLCPARYSSHIVFFLFENIIFKLTCICGYFLMFISVYYLNIFLYMNSNWVSILTIKITQHH